MTSYEAYVHCRDVKDLFDTLRFKCTDNIPLFK